MKESKPKEGVTCPVCGKVDCTDPVCLQGNKICEEGTVVGPMTATEAVYLDSQEWKRKYFESLENKITNLGNRINDADAATEALKMRFDAHELDYEHANLAKEPVDPLAECEEKRAEAMDVIEKHYADKDGNTHVVRDFGRDGRAKMIYGIDTVVAKMQGRKLLILTVGLPRSGKTTWARKQGHPIVSPDSIRLAIHGLPFVASAEPTVWATAYLMVDALFRAGHDTVIIDATNISQKRRAEWIARFPDAVVRIQEFPTVKQMCIWRAKAGGREDLIPVIERMAEEFASNWRNNDGSLYNGPEDGTEAAQPEKRGQKDTADLGIAGMERGR